MGRAKKSRKLRAENRRRKRDRKTIEMATAFLVKTHDRLRERAEMRFAVEASDLPDELKKPLGLLVDPVGRILKMASELAAEYGFDSQPKDNE